jgi:hypothetical protein
MLGLKSSGTRVVSARDLFEEVVVAEVIAGVVTSDDHKPMLGISPSKPSLINVGNRAAAELHSRLAQEQLSGERWGLGLEQASPAPVLNVVLCHLSFLFWNHYLHTDHRINRRGGENRDHENSIGGIRQPRAGRLVR